MGMAAPGSFFDRTWFNFLPLARATRLERRTTEVENEVACPWSVKPRVNRVCREQKNQGREIAALIGDEAA
jgi:hypothetical protein